MACGDGKKEQLEGWAKSKTGKHNGRDGAAEIKTSIKK
jgi:hypothetical protein